MKTAGDAKDRAISGETPVVRPVSHQGVRSLVESAPTLPAHASTGAMRDSGDAPLERVSAPQVLPVRIGETIAGKYVVERVIGQGGAGIVVAATNLDLEERVALKFLRPDVGVLPEVVARFAREARAAVSIKSEHVCKVLDVGTLSNGAPFMVMELLEGRDLWRVMRERGGLPVREAVEYALQVCEALALAHAKGIVHRDVKPENIFLIEHEGLPIVKVLDFGISKAALTTGTVAGSHPSLVTTNNLLGTPAYMSPEQIRASSDVDHRTDIWSLGIVLYEILAGKSAFSAASVPQMSAMILEREPPSLATIRPDVPQGLITVIERCLKKRAAERYETIADLARALLPFAPKRARIYVERCNRTRRREAMVVTGEGVSADEAEDDTQMLLRGEVSKSQPPPAPIVAARAGDAALPTAPITEQRPRSKSTMVLVALTLVGLVVVALALWARRSAPTPIAPATTASASPPPTVAPPPSAEATKPTMSIVAAPTQSEAPSVAPSASASAAGKFKPKSPKPAASKDVDLGF